MVGVFPAPKERPILATGAARRSRASPWTAINSDAVLKGRRKTVVLRRRNTRFVRETHSFAPSGLG
ncbi:MAG: hypothetical protein EA423_10825 [Phycisphaerales bacterium]|nr:MAG: hypothetical protein EA423_10825 [Phycisphaerales bacterium]